MQKENFEIWLKNFFLSNNISLEQQSRIVFLSFNEYSTYVYEEGIFVVFEDWWISKSEIIKSKISTIYGKNQRVYARLCEIRKIDKQAADDFLDENHIYGSCNSKYKLGLFKNEELLAVATFAAQRNFKRGKSAEMLRFCNKNNITVIGGFSKLIKFYLKFYNPDDIMTYVDLDWGNGFAFEKNGFIKSNIKNRLIFFCNKKTGKRVPEKYFDDYGNENNYAIIKKSGSLKMIMNI